MARITVIGSIGEDTVVRLDEPLRAGGHLEGRDCRARIGGGGANTAMPLALAGHAVALVAAVGGDATGRRLLADLKAAGVDAGAIKVIEGAATTRSVIMIEDGGERTIVNLHRTAEPEPPARFVDLPADWLYVRTGPEPGAVAGREGEGVPYCRPHPALRRGRPAGPRGGRLGFRPDGRRAGRPLAGGASRCRRPSGMGSGDARRLGRCRLRPRRPADRAAGPPGQRARYHRGGRVVRRRPHPRPGLGPAHGGGARRRHRLGHRGGALRRLASAGRGGRAPSDS